ncbi:hypothetical protein RHMOL_Rhmol02G0255200 [Rhododendron molle]|uniref:Uncharacterized protein n=1 Tax=Rhododendron molle TaxID=49168 RepID=A0ACC0PTQ4_RHOML|nr:hypothetical protein RHMOL_Rhmol02G0255200 [Rhododendron molle]
MTLPVGYRFRPTDLELVVDYLEKKYSEDEALPCDVVIDREIYGDKAPWQNFTDEDPWEISKTKDKKKDVWKTEGTIYVFTTLTNASQNRIARKAGCGSWHGETAREEVKNDKDCAIGYKTTLYFEIAADEPIAMHGPVEKGHWIMQEYSLRDGDTDKSKGKYVLCRIKRFDSKYTKVSPRKRKNAEAATTDNDLVVSKPAKRVRTEVMQEKKMECDIIAAPDTEVVPFSKDQLFVQDQSFLMSDDPNELTVEELEAIWEEEEEQGSYLPRHCDNSALVPLDRNTVTSNTNFHMPAAYDLDESFPVMEQQQGFGLDCNAFGNISSTPEDDWVQYSNPSHTRAENLSNLSNIEAWLSAHEPLPSDQESDRFLSPNSRFQATAERSRSPVMLASTGYLQEQNQVAKSCLEDSIAGFYIVTCIDRTIVALRAIDNCDALPRMLVNPTESSGINQSHINHRSRSEARPAQPRDHRDDLTLIDRLLNSKHVQNHSHKQQASSAQLVQATSNPYER